MVENYSKYLSEVHPEAKEKKTLELMEKTPDRVAYGFEASFDEIEDFYCRTYTLGATKVKMLQHVFRPSKYRILLQAEICDEGGKRSFDNDIVVADTRISADGEINTENASDFIGDEVDLFRYFGLDLNAEKKKMLSIAIESFNL